jgi:hypothetical protein
MASNMGFVCAMPVYRDGLLLGGVNNLQNFTPQRSNPSRHQSSGPLTGLILLAADNLF